MAQRLEIPGENIRLNFPDDATKQQMRNYVTTNYPGKFPKLDAVVQKEQELVAIKKTREESPTVLFAKEIPGAIGSIATDVIETAKESLVNVNQAFDLLPAAAPALVDTETGDPIPNSGLRAPRVFSATKAAILNSVTVSIATGERGPEFLPSGRIERHVFNIASAVSAAPEFAAGAAIVTAGAITGGGVFSLPAAVIAGFAFKEAIDVIIQNNLQTGSPEDLEEALDLATTAGGGLLKGAIVGGGFVGLGKLGKMAGVAIGARFLGVGGVQAVLGLGGGLAGEITAIGAIPSILEGKLPTVENFEDAAVMMIALRGVRFTRVMLAEQMAKTGRSPRNIVAAELAKKKIDLPLLEAPRIKGTPIIELGRQFEPSRLLTDNILAVRRPQIVTGPLRRVPVDVTPKDITPKQAAIGRQDRLRLTGETPQNRLLLTDANLRTVGPIGKQAVLGPGFSIFPVAEGFKHSESGKVFNTRWEAARSARIIQLNQQRAKAPKPIIKTKRPKQIPREIPRQATSESLIETIQAILDLQKALKEKIAPALKKKLQQRLKDLQENRLRLLEVFKDAEVIPTDPQSQLDRMKIKELRTIAKSLDVNAKGSATQLKGQISKELDARHDRIRPSTEIFEDAKKFHDSYTLRVQETEALQGNVWNKFRKGLPHQIDPGIVPKRLLAKHGSREAQRAFHLFELQSGATSAGFFYARDGAKRVYGGKSRKQILVIDEIISARATIARIERKPGRIEESSPRKARAFLQNLAETLGSEEYLEAHSRASTFFAEMGKQLQRSRQGGLISGESYENLVRAGDYQPRVYIDAIDPDTIGTLGIRTPSSGIPRGLGKGSEALTVSDGKLLLESHIVRGTLAIAQNRPKIALYELARKFPANGFVRVGTTKRGPEGKLFEEKPKVGEAIIEVFVDGAENRVQLIVDKDFVDGWNRVQADPILSQSTITVLGWLLGSKVIKTQATGFLNPAFGLVAFPLDLAHSILSTDQLGGAPFKSNLVIGGFPIMNLPISGAKMLTSLIETSFDTFGKTGEYIDFVKEGGWAETMTTTGIKPSITRGLKTKGLAKAAEIATYLGTHSELWVRMAERHQRLKNIAKEKGVELGELTLSDREAATWGTLNRLHFGDSGNIIKTLDKTTVPYLDVFFQSTRGLARTLIKNPKKFTATAAEIMALSATLYLLNRTLNKEALDSINPHVRGNWIFVLPQSISEFEDQKGVTKHLYISIRSDQEVAFFKVISESLMAKALGDDVDIEAVSAASQALLRLEGARLMPVPLKLILTYTANTDFWRNNLIWRGLQNLSPEKEVKPGRTSPFFEHLAPLLGLSPERTQAAIQTVIPRTYLSGLVGGYVNQIFDTLPEGEDKELVKQELIRRIPFVQTLVKEVRADAAVLRGFTDIEREKNDKTQTQNIALQRFLFPLKQTVVARGQKRVNFLTFDFPITKDLVAYIRSQPLEDRARLLRLVASESKFMSFPSKFRSTWSSIVESDSHLAALKYFQWFESIEGESVRLEVEKQLKQVLLISDKQKAWVEGFVLGLAKAREQAAELEGIVE